MPRKKPWGRAEEQPRGDDKTGPRLETAGLGVLVERFTIMIGLWEARPRAVHSKDSLEDEAMVQYDIVWSTEHSVLVLYVHSVCSNVTACQVSIAN